MTIIFPHVRIWNSTWERSPPVTLVHVQAPEPVSLRGECSSFVSSVSSPFWLLFIRYGNQTLPASGWIRHRFTAGQKQNHCRHFITELLLFSSCKYQNEKELIYSFLAHLLSFLLTAPLLQTPSLNMARSLRLQSVRSANSLPLEDLFSSSSITSCLFSPIHP